MPESSAEGRPHEEGCPDHRRRARRQPVLALAFDGFIRVTQIALGGPEGVLRTFDEDDQVHETRMIVLQDGDVSWVQSGHHFRGWCHRLVANPEVELVSDGGEVRPYLAVPLEDPASKANMKRLIEERVGWVAPG